MIGHKCETVSCGPCLLVTSHHVSLGLQVVLKLRTDIKQRQNYSVKVIETELTEFEAIYHSTVRVSNWLAHALASTAVPFVASVVTAAMLTPAWVDGSTWFAQNNAFIARVAPLNKKEKSNAAMLRKLTMAMQAQGDSSSPFSQ